MISLILLWPPIAFDSQRKNLATISTHIPNQFTKKKHVPVHEFEFESIACETDHQQLQLNIVIEDIERQLRMHGTQKRATSSQRDAQKLQKR